MKISELNPIELVVVITPVRKEMKMMYLKHIENCCFANVLNAIEKRSRLLLIIPQRLKFQLNFSKVCGKFLPKQLKNGYKCNEKPWYSTKESGKTGSAAASRKRQAAPSPLPDVLRLNHAGKKLTLDKLSR